MRPAEPPRAFRLGRSGDAARAASWLLALGVWLAPRSVSAQDDGPGADGGPRWVVGISAERDDDSNDSLLTSYDLAVSDATWLSFSVGRSRAERPGVVADSLEVRIDHRFGLVGVSLSRERWGDPGDLETADLRASLYFAGGRFRVGIDRDKRDIDIYYTLPPLFDRPEVRTADPSADGTGISLRLGLAERWQLYGSWMDYDYPPNLRLLPRIANLNLLGASALTLANSFLAESGSVGVEWTWGNRLLSFSVGSGQSAIDGARFRSLDAAFLFPAGQRMDVEINLGRLDAGVASAGTYGGLLLLIYGGG